MPTSSRRTSSGRSNSTPSPSEKVRQWDELNQAQRPSISRPSETTSDGSFDDDSVSMASYASYRTGRSSSGSSDRTVSGSRSAQLSLNPSYLGAQQQRRQIEALMNYRFRGASSALIMFRIMQAIDHHSRDDGGLGRVGMAYAASAVLQQSYLNGEFSARKCFLFSSDWHVSK